MVEIALIGTTTTLAALFLMLWRGEKARCRHWREAFEFAQTEVARWRKEAETWSMLADRGGGKLVETVFRLPNADELITPPA
jgi:hypothetical protein